MWLREDTGLNRLGMPDRRRVLRALVERVTVRPGRGSAAERVAVTFTDGTEHVPAEPEPEHDMRKLLAAASPPQ